MAYNGHYTVPPTGYYTQPPNAPAFNAPTFHHGFSPSVTPSTNMQRFEANSKIPPMPFWNPEILKQLAQFPGLPPPPPPIPNAQMGTPPFIVQQTPIPQPQHQTTNDRRVKELRNEAKQAISDLSPYIKYQDFLDEGVSQSVLDTLYTDLGIQKNQDAVEAAPEPAQPSAAEPMAEPAAEPVVDAALGRKDRIARLLAAKKARAGTGAVSPAQASTPEVPTTIPDVVTHEIVSTPTPDIPSLVQNESTPAAQESFTAVSNVPTPTSPRPSPQAMRDASTRGFSIPGLSMTTDDQAEQGITQSRPKVNTDKLNARMAALKADMQRKKALQDGMPVLDAEVEKTRDRLSQQQDKVASIREDIQVKESQLLSLREDESRLLEEIERLEKQLAEGEHGQQQFSNELTQLNDQITAQEEESASHTLVSTLTPPVAKTQQPAAAVQILIDDYGVPADQLSEIQGPETGRSPSASEDTPMGDSVTLDHVTAEPCPEVEVQSVHIATTVTPSDIASALENDEDDEQMSIDGGSDAESGGSASMSDSGSDYEPAVDQFDTQAMATEQHDEYEPQDSVMSTNQPPMEVENDEYEPSLKVDAINVDALDIKQTNNDIPELTNAATEAEHDIESSALPTPAEELPPTSAFPTRYSSSERVVPAAQATDDLLTDQQGPPVPVKIYEDMQPLDNKPVAGRSYNSYKSPLATLKSFRFNPQFTQLIPNGYRSLTYSNQIDASRPLCSTELEGKLCTDVKCEEQHFGALGLSGACSPQIC